MTFHNLKNRNQTRTLKLSLIFFLNVCVHMCVCMVMALIHFLSCRVSPINNAAQLFGQLICFHRRHLSSSTCLTDGHSIFR